MKAFNKIFSISILFRKQNQFRLQQSICQYKFTDFGIIMLSLFNIQAINIINADMNKREQVTSNEAENQIKKGIIIVQDTKKKAKYEENGDFSWDSLQDNNPEGPAQAELENNKQTFLNIAPKKINHLFSGEPKDRKLSCNNHAFFVRRAKNNTVFEKKQSSVKSERSASQEDKQQAVPVVPQITWEYHPPQEDVQSYFNKKMRSLEAKFKKSTLQHDTIAFKLKHQNKALSSQLAFYKQFLAQNHPQISKQMQQKYKEKQVFGSNKSQFSSSSSSDESNKVHDQIIMPVQSQILEVKMQGHKLCQKVKAYESEISQLKKTVGNMKTKFQNIKIHKALSLNQQYRDRDREKKQSFQTTLISQKSQQTISQNFSYQSQASSQFYSHSNAAKLRTGY